MLGVVLERVDDATPVLVDLRRHPVVLAVARLYAVAGVRPNLLDGRQQRTRPQQPVREATGATVRVPTHRPAQSEMGIPDAQLYFTPRTQEVSIVVNYQAQALP